MPHVKMARQREHADAAGLAGSAVAAGFVDMGQQPMHSQANQTALHAGARLAPRACNASAAYFLPGLAGAAFFSATLWSRELPYELRKRLPLAVRLSPLPMMFSLMSVDGLIE